MAAACVQLSLSGLQLLWVIFDKWPSKCQVFWEVGWNGCHPQEFSKKVVHSLLTYFVTLLPTVVDTSGDIFQTAFKIKIPFLIFSLK